MSEDEALRRAGLELAVKSADVDGMPASEVTRAKAYYEFVKDLKLDAKTG